MEIQNIQKEAILLKQVIEKAIQEFYDQTGVVPLVDIQTLEQKTDCGIAKRTEVKILTALA